MSERIPTWGKCQGYHIVNKDEGEIEQITRIALIMPDNENYTRLGIRYYVEMGNGVHPEVQLKEYEFYNIYLSDALSARLCRYKRP